MIKSVFVVSSGQLIEGDSNPHTMILSSFTTRVGAEQWIDSMIARDSSFNPEVDFYDIEEVSLYDFMFG